MKQQYGVDSMPETGENVAEEYQVARADQDAFACARSSAPARRSPAGYFAEEIVPVEVAGRQGRAGQGRQGRASAADTTLEALAKLKPPFRNPGTVTAGNASGVNDGAAALILASEDGREAPRPDAARAHARHGVGRRAAAGHGHRPGAGDPQADGAARPQDRRLRRDRTQRGLRLAGARLPAPARARRRCRARQSAWRRDRARPSARHVGRAARADRRRMGWRSAAASARSPPCASASARACRWRSSGCSGPHAEERRAVARLEAWPRAQCAPPSFETRPVGAPQDEVGEGQKEIISCR